MVKYIYQAVALVFIFAGALFLFGRNMETDMEEKGVTGCQMHRLIKR